MLTRRQHALIILDWQNGVRTRLPDETREYLKHHKMDARAVLAGKSIIPRKPKKKRKSKRKLRSDELRELNLKFKAELPKYKTTRGRQACLRRYFKQGGSKSWAKMIIGYSNKNSLMIDYQYKKAKEKAK